MTKRTTVLMFLATVLFCLGAVGFGVYWVYTSLEYTGRQFAIYDDMQLNGGTEGYYSLITGDLDHRRELAPLFVRLPDGNVALLPNLDEGVIAELHESKSDDRSGRPFQYFEEDVGRVTKYHWRLSSFAFVDGRLIFAIIARDSFEIALSENGPFYGFPIERSVSEKLFGKPNEIKKEKWDIRRSRL